MKRTRWRSPAADFDPVAHLVRSLAEVPYGWDVEVILHVEVEQASRLGARHCATSPPRR